MRASALITALLLLSQSPAYAITDGQVYGDWRAKCVEAGNSGQQRSSCHIFQDLLQKDTGKRVLHLAIGRLPDKQPLAIIITLPLGISLPPGLKILIDGQYQRQEALHACFANGCQAAFELEPVWLNRLTRGKQAEVIFHNIHNKPISIPVSLKGIGAALKELQTK